MAQERVGLKIKITNNVDGTLNYPDFKNMLEVFSDPSYEPPTLYTDRTSDCKRESPHSPRGTMWGLKLADVAFATQALAAFPSRVSVMTESEIAEFWGQKVYAHLPDCRYDSDILTSLKIERDLRDAIGENTAAIDQQIRRALNPDDVEPGIRRNPMKTWAQAKQRLDVTIVAP